MNLLAIRLFNEICFPNLENLPFHRAKTAVQCIFAEQLSGQFADHRSHFDNAKPLAYNLWHKNDTSIVMINTLHAIVHCLDE